MRHVHFRTLMTVFGQVCFETSTKMGILKEIPLWHICWHLLGAGYWVLASIIKITFLI